MSYFYLALAIAAEVAGTSLLKQLKNLQGLYQQHF
jgi:multidrug transporter EmrE-like cation transporter